MPFNGMAEHLMAIAAGEKPMPVTNARRHHYVPQFLLRNFTTPHEVGEPKLRILDKTTGSITEATTRGTAWERNLYSIHDEGERDNRVEAFLSVIETYAADALVRFLADPLSLDYEDRVTLSIYLALQESRTPAALAEKRELLRQMGTMHAAVGMANAHGKEREQIRKAHEALLAGQIGVEPTDSGTLSMMFRALIEVAQTICGLSWMLWEATEGEFVLSDRPLTRHDPRPPHAFSAGAWMSSPFVYTTLPLDPTHCLRISPHGSAPVILHQTSKQITRTNLRTYGWGTRYVLGRSAAVLGELHQQAQRDPDSVPHPIPQRIVILEDEETADPGQAEANRARGWAPRLFHKTDKGVEPLSYTVIDSVQDVRTAMAPRPVEPTSE